MRGLILNPDETRGSRTALLKYVVKFARGGGMLRVNLRILTISIPHKA